MGISSSEEISTGSDDECNSLINEHVDLHLTWDEIFDKEMATLQAATAAIPQSILKACKTCRSQPDSYECACNGENFILVDAPLKQKIDLLWKAITVLQDNKSEFPSHVAQLASDVEAVNRAMNSSNRVDIEALLKRANTAQGSSSIPLKAVGVAMMMLGVALLVLSGFVLTGSAILSSTVILAPLAAVGVPMGLVLATSGLAMSCAGFSVFSKGRQQGVSRALNEIGSELVKDRIPLTKGQY